MVSRPLRSSLLPFLAAVGVVVSQAKEPADYRLGDQITEDIITPVPLMVVDPVATRALKSKEENRIPVIFRYNETAVATVEASLREAFAQARSNFLARVTESFGRSEVTADQMESDRFLRVLHAFKHDHPAFPLSEEMAREWAGGNTVLPEQISLSARVHQAMEGLIRHDNLTNAPKLGSMVLLVPVNSETETIGLDDVKARGYNEPRTNVLTMSRARLALLENFSKDEAAMAKFATRCLRVNCFAEIPLTRLARARHTDPLFAADHYQAGQVIARKGQLVDARVMAALTVLQEKTAAGRLAAEVAHERENAAREQAQAAQARENNKWLLIGLVTAGGVLVVVLFSLAFRRRREPAALQPMLNETKTVPLIGATAPEGVTATATATDSWQQRALAAERKVEEAHAAIRAGVMAQLKEKLVSNLASQRGEMLGVQESAAAELAELEQRLNELHAPLQERLGVYEARIAELEKALAAKGEENRELIKAKIEMMRRQIESERSKPELHFN